MEYQKDYEVSVPSAFSLDYREGEKVMKIDMDFRDPLPVLSFKAIRAWEPPHNAEPVSEDHKRQILKNLQFYLEQVRGLKFTVA